MLLELPRDGGPAPSSPRRGRERSIELFPVAPYHHGGRATRDGVVVGYAALPEHAFDAGLAALGDLLAEA